MVNEVTLIGRLGSDPKTAVTGKDLPVARLNLATSEKYKDKTGQVVEKTEWHSIVAWDQLAGLCEKYLRKGSSIYVRGKLSTREYEKDGVKHKVTEVVANQIKFLDTKGAEGKQETTNNKAKTQDRRQTVQDDFDIPF